jgi:CcmD family protein
MIRRAVMMIASLLLAGPVFALQPPSPPTGFVPVNQPPAGEQMAAAPLIVAAYAFVWVAVLVYLWSIWRRLGKVEAEMQTLERRLGQRTSAR